MKKTLIYSSLYAFIFPIFHAVYLYSQNVSEVEWTAVVRPILVLLLMQGLLYAFFLLVRQKHAIAGFISFIVMFTFLNYGILYSFLREHPVFGVNLGRHVILGPVSLLLAAAVSFLVLSGRFRIGKNTRFFLNLCVGLLFLFTLVNTIISASAYISTSTAVAPSSSQSAQLTWVEEVKSPAEVSEGQVLPDIYYIIPDMFARGDVIEEETGFDNSAFIEELRQMGFYVADCSRSNYASTQRSIASSLNMSYLDQIQDGMTDRSMLKEPMNNSLLRVSLEELGYRTVTFDNAFGLPEVRDADKTISAPKGFFLFERFTPFENMIVKGSLLRLFYDVNLGRLSDLYDRFFFPYWEHVDAQKYIFDSLPESAQDDAPQFVFAHIMMPHPPYLIRADGTIETDSSYYREALGQPVSEELYLQGYLMQTQYVQNRITEVVREILANSKEEPIIIIQGDHGIRDENRLDILNAYYVPHSIRDDLYPGITPVNTFRVIMNGLFNTSYEILPDESWYSLYPNWFEMELDEEHNPTCVAQ